MRTRGKRLSHASPALARGDARTERAADAAAKQLLNSVEPSPTAINPEATRQADVSPGSASGARLPESVRNFFEPRLGMSLDDVSVHADSEAHDRASALGARAFVQGNSIWFGRGEYAPEADGGRELLAHELAHVAQVRTGQADATAVHCQISSDDADLAAEREYGDSPAPNAKKCSIPSHCPPGFCDPYRSEKLAEYYRAKNGPVIMAGIAVAVDSKVLPLWREYLAGGSGPKDLSADFGADFTKSKTTASTTQFLANEIKSSLASKPPSIGFADYIDIKTLIPGPISRLDDPGSPNQMNFSFPRDIAGNIAGGIAKDQTSCPAGKQPSPFNDERLVSGGVLITRRSDTAGSASLRLSYTVKDTIDLCPGDCGTTLERVATVPLSQFEATGISGDVPFTVNFPAPPTDPFDIALAPRATASPFGAPGPIVPYAPAPKEAPKEP